MKTIATITASLLLSLGLLVSPASAEEPAAPTPTCEELSQKWLAAALEAELNTADAATLIALQRDAIEWDQERVVLIQRAEQQATRIANQRAKISELRRKLHKARSN